MSAQEPQDLPKFVSEAIGTFALVFVGTGAIVVDVLTEGALSPLGVSLAFGLVIMTMIYAVGDISGAHLNPAVTLGFFVAGRMPGREVLPYLAAQLIGAVAGSAMIRLFFGDVASLGSTQPTVAIGIAFAMEVTLTFLLMFVILGVATGDKEEGIMAGVAIGSVVCFAALFGGPISGASMNPARSLGPALVSGTFASLWLYLSAPFVGAGLAVGACRVVRGPDCCGGSGIGVAP